MSNGDYVAPDRKTFAELMSLLPSDGLLMSTLEHHNFAGFAFRKEVFEQADEFSHWAERVDKEFLDADLESMRVALADDLNRLFNLLAMNTWVLKTGDARYSSVPPEWETEQPKRFKKVVGQIDEYREAVLDQYRALVRQCRRKLAI